MTELLFAQRNTAGEDWRGVRIIMQQVRDELLVVDDPVSVDKPDAFDEQIVSLLEDAERLRPGFAKTFFEYMPEAGQQLHEADRLLAQKAIKVASA